MSKYSDKLEARRTQAPQGESAEYNRGWNAAIDDLIAKFRLGVPKHAQFMLPQPEIKND